MMWVFCVSVHWQCQSAASRRQTLHSVSCCYVWCGVHQFVSVTWWM